MSKGSPSLPYGTLDLLVLKPGRFFMPRKSPPRTRTHYPDAWEESARRTPTPPPEAME